MVHPILFMERTSELSHHFAKFSPKELKSDLSHLFKELPFDQVKKKLELCAEVLPCDLIQQAFGKEALSLASELFTSASYYLEATKSSAPSAVQKLITTLVDIQAAIAESLISAFGVTTLFAPAENAMMGEFKLHRLTTLISTVSLLTTLVLPLIGEAIAGYIMGAACLVLAAVSLIYPYIKPIPSVLPSGGENITKQLVDGALKPVYVRKAYLDSIASAFSHTRRPHHAMLIGDYGVGKSEVPIAFAQAILDGKYPELAGMTVYSFNAAKLKSKDNPWVSMTKIEEILAALGRHRKNSILVIDEFHALCEEKNIASAIELLSVLDNKGDSGIPKCLAITTQEQINDIEASNYGLSDRFEKVVVESSTETETVAILTKYYMRQDVKPLLVEGAMSEIYTKTTRLLSDQPQPKISLKVFSKCCKETEIKQARSTANEIANIQTQILAHNAEKALNHLKGYRGKVKSGSEKLEKRLQELEEQLKIQNETIERFYATKSIAETMTQVLFDTAVKVAQVKDRVLLGKLVLFDQFIQMRLNPELKRLTNELEILGLTVEVNSALIDEIIAKERADIEAQKNAQSKGKKQRKGRATSL